MAEQYANDVSTTLNGAVLAADSSIVVTSATGMPSSGDFRLKIGSEILICTARTGTTLTVTRAAESTTAASYSSGTRVSVVLTKAALEALVTQMKTRVLVVQLDGGGSAITTGVKADIRVPFTGTISKVTLLADQSGSIVIDLWKDAYANYPPTVADTITASAKPTLSSAVKAEDSTLTGWTTSITSGDVIRVNVDSASTVTRVTLEIEVTVQYG